MKTFLAFLLAFSLAAIAQAQTNAPSAAEWQSIVSGTALKVDCPSKKLNGPGYGGVYTNLDIIVSIKNSQTNPVFYNLNVLFISKFRSGSSMPEEAQARDKQSSELSLDPMSATNVNFHAVCKNGGQTFDIAWSGYIVRLSAYGKPLKIIASSPALERIAKDPEKMKLLEDGKTVPVK